MENCYFNGWSQVWDWKLGLGCWNFHIILFTKEFTARRSWYDGTNGMSMFFIILNLRFNSSSSQIAKTSIGLLLTKLTVQYIISCTDTLQDCIKIRNLCSYDHGHKSLFNWCVNTCEWYKQHNSMFPQEPLESQNKSCRSFIGRLNESLAVWGDRLPVEAR